MEHRLIIKIVQAMELEVGDIVLLNFWGREEEIEDCYNLFLDTLYPNFKDLVYDKFG